MDRIDEIKPCPFCGSLGVALVGSFVRCGSCGAAGPYGYTDAEAVERWNARVAEVVQSSRMKPQHGDREQSPLQ